MIEGTGCPWEIASPCGDTMVQAALHWASSRGFPFSALKALSHAAPTKIKAHVKIATLIAILPCSRWPCYSRVASSDYRRLQSPLVGFYNQPAPARRNSANMPKFDHCVPTTRGALGF